MRSKGYETHDYAVNRPFLYIMRMPSTPALPGCDPHWHESIEILHFVDGEACVVDNKQEIVCCAGDTVVFNSNTEHSVHQREGTSHYHCLLINKDYFSKLDMPLFRNHFIMLPNDENLKQMFEELSNEYIQKPLMYNECMKSIISKMMIFLYRHYCDNADEVNPILSHPQIVQAALNYIYQHFKEDITVNQMAKDLGFSPYYLCHAFKTTVGHTIGQHVRTTRCNYASRLLSSGYYTVWEAAEMAGFKTPAYFSKVYKTETGRLPNEDLPRKK